MGFFNNFISYAKNHKVEMAYRGWNGLVAGAVIYDLATNPTANVGEYVGDILLHSYEFAFPNQLNPIMLSLNLLRGVQA
ncbi:MAG TPA: hypothetical protein PLD88_12840, partial [Candidatus Berkiella sp.]|nr:hypothetical protein [Candidatus Berkiella sp.]